MLGLEDGGQPWLDLTCSAGRIIDTRSCGSCPLNVADTTYVLLLVA